MTAVLNLHLVPRVGAAALFLAACAAGNAGDAPGDRLTSSARPTTADPSAAGAPAPMAPPSMGAFGNSSAQPPTPPPDDGMTLEDACEVGERCGPQGPDPDDCGSLTLEAEVEVIENPGNVLLVFDRSSSMADDWSGSTRWETAGGAIDAALTPLADLLTVGSVFFPSSDPNATPVCVDPTGIACIFVPFLLVSPGTCGVNPITSVDQIDFEPGPAFLTSFGGAANTAPPYAPVPGGFTPLSEALQEAQLALDASALTGLTSVVIITDGERNCEWDAAISRQIVTDWAAAGIRTYVVGLPGVQGNGTQVLNDLAMTGGTGQYISPDSATDLEMALRDIATETVQAGFDSCEIVIDPPAEVPDKLHLVVTEGGVDQEVARELSDDASWAITDDGSLVTLEGLLCDDAMGGRFEALRFEFGCVELPPLPPPKAPD